MKKRHLPHLGSIINQWPNPLWSIARMQGPREASSSNDWTLSCHSHTQAVGVEQLHGRWCPRVVLQAPGLHVHVGWVG